MKKSKPDYSFNRRDFIKGSSFASMMMMMGGVEITAQSADEQKTLPVPKADPNFKEKQAGPPVNFGVIGLGAQGKDILATLARLPNAPVVAVAETYAASLRRAGDAAAKASKHENYKELLDNKNVQAVVVATPTHQHKQIVIEALQAGKHVYCEAPMAHSVEDAKAIAQAAKNASAQIFQVGLQYRANPQHHHVLNFVRSGAMGKGLFGRGQYHKRQSWRRASPNADREKELNWRLDSELSTGLIGEVGVHQVDVASWYFNSLPIAATGFGGIIEWSDGRDVPDTIQAVIEFPRKQRFVYTATLGNSFEGSYDVFYGTESALMLRDQRAWMFKEVDSPLLGWEVYARKEEFFKETGIALVANATKLLAQGKKPAEGASDSDTPLFYALEEFVANINEKKQPSAGWEAGYTSAVIAIKTNEAIRKGGRLEFDKSWFQV
ncbi:MAG TPA: Gfo/Idh/MocA family oxidoreductase [Methylomirabilota bacterium]|nr:Gfo/Idh/MocA family oxidoreductase [Methylomirabilota bacterium]